MFDQGASYEDVRKEYGSSRTGRSRLWAASHISFALCQRIAHGRCLLPTERGFELGMERVTHAHHVAEVTLYDCRLGLRREARPLTSDLGSRCHFRVARGLLQDLLHQRARIQ